MPFPLAVKPRAVIEPLQFQSMAGPALLRSVMFSRVRLELPLPPRENTSFIEDIVSSVSLNSHVAQAHFNVAILEYAGSVVILDQPSFPCQPEDTATRTL